MAGEPTPRDGERPQIKHVPSRIAVREPRDIRDARAGAGDLHDVRNVERIRCRLHRARPMLAVVSGPREPADVICRSVTVGSLCVPGRVQGANRDRESTPLNSSHSQNANADTRWKKKNRKSTRLNSSHSQISYAVF